MSTRICGASDDLIEFGGDVCGEVGGHKRDAQGHGTLLICSDGTLLHVSYGKADLAIWSIEVLREGTLYDCMDVCISEDDNPFSDVAHFGAGLRWVYAAEQWEKVL